MAKVYQQWVGAKVYQLLLGNIELEQRSINCCLATVSWSKGLSTVAWEQWVGAKAYQLLLGNSELEHHKMSFFSASAFSTPQFELNALTLLYNFSQPCYCEVIVPSVKSLPISLCATSSARFYQRARRLGTKQILNQSQCAF